MSQERRDAHPHSERVAHDRTLGPGCPHVLVDESLEAAIEIQSAPASWPIHSSQPGVELRCEEVTGLEACRVLLLQKFADHRSD